jgi:cytochrome c peroxidase
MRGLRAALLPVAILLLSGCSGGNDFPSDDELGQISGLHNVTRPSHSSVNKYADSPDAASLGKKLFNDPGFSSCGAIACVSCHPAPAYTVPLPFPPGCNGSVERSPPSLLNTAFHDWYYWDGRKDALWSHPIFPLLNHTELAATPTSVKQRMVDQYSSDYQKAFGTDPAAESDEKRVVANFGKALDAYLRTLVRVTAPFDDDLTRFMAAAQAGNASKDPLYAGLKVFIRSGRCIICHKGPMLSDGSFHNIGVRQDTPDDHGHLTGIDILKNDPWNSASIYSDDQAAGMAKLATLDSLTHDDLDGAFKTPSLRNVSLTAPYMHNSRYATLNDVVDFYNRGGDPEGTFPGKRAVTIIKLNLTADEKQALIALLMSLTGSEQP